MGKDFFEAFVEAKALYEKANEILGSDLTTVSFEGPEDMLKQTRFTQPALYVNSLVIADLLKQKGIVAEAAAGHSLGEFSALAYAGAFSYEDGLALVKVRAELMQEAGENQPGTMAAIVGMEAEDVMSICIEVREKGIVQPANYNSPQQIVISGSVEGVNAAMELAKERGFAWTVHGEPTIGGRYSALSPFGMVPAALMDLDVRTFLERAETMAQWCRLGDENPGLEFGLQLGESWGVGRDKVCIDETPGGFGLWAEQLVAESTGKEGKGLVPAPGEDPAGGPDRQHGRVRNRAIEAIRGI